MAMSHSLVVPNLPPGEEFNALNLKKVLSQSKFVYLLPSDELTMGGDANTDAYVSGETTPLLPDVMMPFKHCCSMA